MDPQSPSQYIVHGVLSESISDAVAESIGNIRLHVKASKTAYHIVKRLRAAAVVAEPPSREASLAGADETRAQGALSELCRPSSPEACASCPADSVGPVSPVSG